MIFEPRDQDQLDGLQHLIENSFGGLFWDPGVGKTGVSLMAFKILRDAGFVRRMHVLSSVNIIRDVWPDEIEKFDNFDMTYAMVHGGPKKREAAMELDADVYLMSYQGMPWFRKKYKRRHGLDMLMVDESDRYRNRGAKTLFGSLKWMLPSYSRRYILTGTPAPRGYMGLWPQVYIVDQGRTLGERITTYRNRYFTPHGFKGKEWALREGADEEIQRAIASLFHRAEHDLDVDIEFRDLWVRMPPKAMRTYRELEHEFIAEWRGKTLVAANAGVATQKLRQAANGSIYYDRKGSFVVLHDRKIAKLAELSEDLRLRGNPLLTAYSFKHDYEAMKRVGLDIPSYSIAKGSQRSELKRAWNDGELDGLSGNYTSLSHGLNLQFGGWNLGCFGVPWSLNDYEQFYKRLWRSGQEHNVRVYRMLTEGTIDEVMIETLEKYGNDQQALLRGVKEHYGV